MTGNTLKSQVEVPTEVRTAHLLWLVAIGAGVFETVLVVLDAASSGGIGAGIVTGVAVRVVLFVALTVIIFQMRAGRNWARWALAILLGGLGTLSLVIGPIGWLADGHSVRDAVADADALTFLFAGSRLIHLAAVLAGVAALFLPATNAYFRSAAR